MCCAVPPSCTDPTFVTLATNTIVVTFPVGYTFSVGVEDGSGDYLYHVVTSAFSVTCTTALYVARGGAGIGYMNQDPAGATPDHFANATNLPNSHHVIDLLVEWRPAGAPNCAWHTTANGRNISSGTNELDEGDAYPFLLENTNLDPRGTVFLTSPGSRDNGHGVYDNSAFGVVLS